MNTIKILTAVATTALLIAPNLAPAQSSIESSKTLDAVKSLDAAKKIIRARFPEVQQMTTDELANLMGDPKRAPVLLDVRSKAEYNVSHIPGAIRVDPGIDAVSVTPLMRPGRAVVAYCSIGYRSSALAEQLMGTGAPWIYNLEGSIFQWANEGRPLESYHQPTNRVHPYNRMFARMLLPTVVRAGL